MEELIGNDGQLLIGIGGKVSPFPEAETEAESETSDANVNVDEARPLNLMISPPPQKLRPIRCFSNSSALPNPLQTQQQHQVLASASSSNNNWINGFDSAELGFLPSSQDSARMLSNADEVYRTSLLKIKCQMDANLISTMNSQISLLPFSFSSSSDGSGDSAYKGKEDGPRVNLKRKKRKKLECFLEELMGKVMQKQEQMHQQLMEIIEKKERERIVREEAWRRQEMERAQMEQEMRSQEAARNLALSSFIQNALAQDNQMLQRLPPNDAQTQTNPIYKPANV